MGERLTPTPLLGPHGLGPEAGGRGPGRAGVEYFMAQRHLAHVAAMPFLGWPTLLEPVRLCEAGRFLADHPVVHAAYLMIDSYFKEYFNSLGLENGFNDIRDNERRGAKHQQRGDGALHSLEISSMATRWAKSPNEFRPTLVSLDEQAVASCKALHVEPKAYRAAAEGVTEKQLGFKVQDLTKPSVHWPSTSPDRFSVVELAHFHAMFHNPDDFLDPDDPDKGRVWDCLGLAIFYKPGLVISTRASQDVYYVVDATHAYLTLVHLGKVAEGAFLLRIARDTLHEYYVTTSIRECGTTPS